MVVAPVLVESTLMRTGARRPPEMRSLPSAGWRTMPRQAVESPGPGNAETAVSRAPSSARRPQAVASTPSDAAEKMAAAVAPFSTNSRRLRAPFIGRPIVEVPYDGCQMACDQPPPGPLQLRP